MSDINISGSGFILNLRIRVLRFGLVNHPVTIHILNLLIRCKFRVSNWIWAQHTLVISLLSSFLVGLLLRRFLIVWVDSFIIELISKTCTSYKLCLQCNVGEVVNTIESSRFHHANVYMQQSFVPKGFMVFFFWLSLHLNH